MNLPNSIAGENFVLDTETTGLNIMVDTPLYLGWRLPGKHGTVRWSEGLVNWLNDHLPTAKVVVAHNAKFDCHMLIQGGVFPTVIDYTPVYCTMVGEQLCDEHRLSYSLDDLGHDLLNMRKSSSMYHVLADKFGGKPDKSQLKHLRHAPLELIEKYVNQDTHICQCLFSRQKDEIPKQGLGRISEIEQQVVKVLMRMERRGAPIFKDRAEQAIYAMRDAVDVADDDLWACVGYRTNPNSQPALRLAFEMLGLPAMDSFDKDHLALVDHPVGQKILDYRQILVTQNTFVEGLQEFIGRDGRIHCNFNQNKHEDGGTRTGRLSATKPNLQQIPMRVETVAKVVRSLFGEKGRGWCAGDWSQFEYRIFAHFVGDENVLAAYRNNPATDYHQALADITGIPRNKAKRVNLGLVFSMGEGKLAKTLGLPCTEYVEDGKTRYQPGPEAQLLFSQYHSKVPKTRPYLKASTQEGEAKGFVRSLFGRKIRFPDRNKAYKAGGLRFQASAADLMKQKLIEVDQALMCSGIGSELILVVHDEFDVLSPEGEEEKTCKLMKEIMEDIPDLQVPVLADVSHGHDWWEASS